MSVVDVIDGKLKVVKKWSYDIKGTDDGSRFYDFYNTIDNIVLEYKPNVICLEKPMSMMNGNTSKTLIGYYSILKLIAYMRMVRISEIFPTSMKKLISGSGRAEKEEVANTIATKLKCHISEIVEYERYCVGKNKGSIKKVLYDISDSIGLILTTIILDGGEIDV